MDYGIKAIPTEINGIKYRSRLEAKYAEFFRLIGWEADYEPFDMVGWAPDFMIKGSRYAEHPILIEVKPFITPDLIEEQKRRTSEIRNCIVLLVGDKPFFDDDPVKFAHILRQPPDEKGYFHFDETADWKNRPFDIGSIYGIFDGIVHNNGETRKNFI